MRGRQNFGRRSRGSTAVRGPGVFYWPRTARSGGATAEEAWPDIFDRVKLSHVDVLKASHHSKVWLLGSAVKGMSPLLTITSVGGS